MSSPKKKTEQIGLRLDEDLMAEFEEYALQLETAAGVRISRGEIARRLLVHGLAAVRAAEAATSRGNSAV